MENLQEFVAEYLAPVETNNSLTIEHKRLVSENVRGFVKFVEAKKHAIDNPPEPVKELPEPEYIKPPQGVSNEIRSHQEELTG